MEMTDNPNFDIEQVSSFVSGNYKPDAYSQGAEFLTKLIDSGQSRKTSGEIASTPAKL